MDQERHKELNDIVENGVRDFVHKIEEDLEHRAEAFREQFARDMEELMLGSESLDRDLADARQTIEDLRQAHKIDAQAWREKLLKSEGERDFYAQETQELRDQLEEYTQQLYDADEDIERLTVQLEHLRPKETMKQELTAVGAIDSRGRAKRRYFKGL